MKRRIRAITYHQVQVTASSKNLAMILPRKCTLLPASFPLLPPSSCTAVSHAFYYSLSSLSLCFLALQVGGIDALLRRIDEQKGIKHLSLIVSQFVNSVNMGAFISCLVCPARILTIEFLHTDPRPRIHRKKQPSPPLAVTTQRNLGGGSFEITDCSSESLRLVLKDDGLRR